MHIRTTLACVSASLFITTSTLAADLPVAPKAPPLVPVWSWTGFYVGVHGGFGGDVFAYPIAAPAIPLAAEATLNSSGFFGGGQIGYNYQIGPSWVVGVEADISASGIEGKLSANVTTPVAVSLSAGSELEWFGTVRGRIGYLINPYTLLYGTGGYAFGSTKSLATITGIGAGINLSTTRDKSGWAAGGGIEYAFNHWLSLKAEYLYIDLGTDNLLSLGGGALTVDETTTVHTIKAGLNVKLGSLFGGPVAAAHAPVAAPEPVSWTGFYVGGHGGYGGDVFTYPIAAPALPLAAEAELNSSGFFGGGQIGFNYQFLPAWVAGVEADVSASGIEGKLSANVTAPVAVSVSAGSELEWFATVRGRLGYLLTRNALVYGTGGYAFGSTKSLFTLTGIGGGINLSTTRDKSGWAAGGGVEYSLNRWLTFKLEYLYLDLGRDNLLSLGGGALTIDETTTVHTIKAGLNFQLGSLWR